MSLAIAITMVLAVRESTDGAPAPTALVAEGWLTVGLTSRVMRPSALMVGVTSSRMPVVMKAVFWEMTPVAETLEVT